MNQRNLNSRQKGFTVVEVLVSMVVLSIGIMGLSVLQLSSVQNSSGGQLRSQATILAYDIIDAMRANTPAVSSNKYGAVTASYFDQDVQVSNCIGADANCSSDDMALADLSRWYTILGNYLPSGSGRISRVVAGGVATVTVQVTWFDPFTAEDGSQRITLEAEMPL